MPSPQQNSLKRLCGSKGSRHQRPGAAGGAAGAGAAGGATETGDPGAEGTGSVSAIFGGAARPRPYYVPLLQQVLGSPPSSGPPPFLSSPPIQPASPLPGPSPYSGPVRGLTERREPESRPVSPESRSASPVRLLALVRVPLPSPPVSSLPAGPDPKSDSLRAASPAVTHFEYCMLLTGQSHVTSSNTPEAKGSVGNN
ncbi:unnamed protein product [Closterium sp. NIES-54]